MANKINRCLILYLAAILTAVMSVAFAAGHIFRWQGTINRQAVLCPEYGMSIGRTVHADIFSMDVSAMNLDKFSINSTPEKLPVISEEELDLFARCVQAEAGNQGLEGKRLVADVILNRVDSDTFPDTITEVILQKTGHCYQFSVVGDGAIDRAEPDEETYEAIRLKLESRSHPELMYFAATGYLPYGEPWGKVGGHYFNTE